MNTDYSECKDYVEKNHAGADLSFKEALHLFELPLPVIGGLADEIRRMKCGELVTFVVDRNISYTNRCGERCKFCAVDAEIDE